MSKYHAIKTTVDNITFASKAEARHYGELKLLEKAGLITDIHLQVQYSIEVNGKHICNYYADFTYWENGEQKIIDVKGIKTPVYRLKKKLVEAIHGIKITEVE